MWARNLRSMQEEIAYLELPCFFKRGVKQCCILFFFCVFRFFHFFRKCQNSKSYAQISQLNQISFQNETSIPLKPLLPRLEITDQNWRHVCEANTLGTGVTSNVSSSQHVATLWRHLAYWPSFLSLIYEYIHPISTVIFIFQKAQCFFPIKISMNDSNFTKNKLLYIIFFNVIQKEEKQISCL